MCWRRSSPRVAGRLQPGPHSRCRRTAAALSHRTPGARRLNGPRRHTLGRHSGQVSLSWRRCRSWESFEQAALREAHEEIALPLDGVRVIGALTPLDIPVSGFRRIRSSPSGRRGRRCGPADGEVARILEPALAELLDANCVRSTERMRDGRTLTIPAFHVRDEEIWARLPWFSPNSSRCWGGSHRIATDLRFVQIEH